MVERRNLVGGGIVAGLSALVKSSPAEAAAAAGGGQDGDSRVAREVSQLRTTIESQFQALQRTPWGVEAVRRQQRDWLRSAHKYPDFIEIGISVWENVYDWHVRHQQPISVARLADGRYAMTFMFTTLLLRTDLALDFVGYPFESDARGRQ